MRLVTYRWKGELRAGAVVGDNVIELPGSSVRQLIAEGVPREAPGKPFAALAEIELDLPIPDPGKIICVGVNYMDRNAEYRDGSQAPQYPSLFMRTPLSLVPHGSALVIPKESEQLDYEGEIVLVIGKGGRRIAESEAHAHVAGLSIMNEGSVRDWLRHGKFNVTQGKNFDRSGSLGPWIETDLSGIDLTDLRIETRVNGEVRQSDTTANMAFPIARIIAYVSSFTTLLPGDLIATGTPSGAGARFDPPRWLKEGDRVEVAVAGVGTLRNGVAAES